MVYWFAVTRCLLYLIIVCFVLVSVVCSFEFVLCFVWLFGVWLLSFWFCWLWVLFDYWMCSLIWFLLLCLFLVTGLLGVWFIALVGEFWYLYLYLIVLLTFHFSLIVVYCCVLFLIIYSVCFDLCLISLFVLVCMNFVLLVCLWVLCLHSSLL